ncbi:hypothetical protein BC939DRAFT_272951 [Gamsiella multidivaricata]|uniref:uncharacterized protein n=1 Tax=Gamsiella multidivaricata TaxID=101098 RepID=UPI002220EE02|nr:uncharacterized protein BC939DRAFT_272951 [Gamsiella multidivaricata]KAI7819014.1 hypothetical protein BC939DRAFT_272951 [Gamsiella multidivaricata]
MSSIQSRWFHASTLVNSTLYITGGTQRDNAGATSISDECLALDLSQPWSIEKPLFMTMPRLSMPLSGHSMNKVPGSTQLLVAGGESTANLTIFPILLFETSGGSMQNIADGTWISPTKPANIAASPYRLYPASITTGKDGVLLHGGYPTTAVVNATVLSSLVTLKPSNNFAPKYSAPVSMALNSPALARHTMTLMPDGRAIILGGTTSQNVLTNLSMAYVMDTQASNASWNIVSLSGKPPDPRVAFSTVLVNTTTLLLYGGTSDFKSAFWVTFYLDLPTMAWSSPMAQGRAPRRWGHTATMAGSTMVVAFGIFIKAITTNPSKLAVIGMFGHVCIDKS